MVQFIQIGTRLINVANIVFADLDIRVTDPTVPNSPYFDHGVRLAYGNPVPGKGTKYEDFIGDDAEAIRNELLSLLTDPAMSAFKTEMKVPD